MPRDINIELIHVFWKKKINYQILEYLNKENKPKTISEVALGINADKTDIRRAVMWDKNKSRKNTTLTSLGIIAIVGNEPEVKIEITEKGMMLLWMTILINP